jgi:hypothetical protein
MAAVLVARSNQAAALSRLALPPADTSKTKTAIWKYPNLRWLIATERKGRKWISGTYHVPAPNAFAQLGGQNKDVAENLRDLEHAHSGPAMRNGHLIRNARGSQP